jgi:hypothetical protein
MATHDKAIKHASATSTNTIINHTHCNNHQPHPPTATTTQAPQHGQHLLIWHENLQQDADKACYTQTGPHPAPISMPCHKWTMTTWPRNNTRGRRLGRREGRRRKRERKRKGKGKRALLGRFPPPVLLVADPPCHGKTSTNKAMEVAAAAEPSKLTK